MSRIGYLIFTSFLALSAVVFSRFQHAPRLPMWNESASVPVGLYALHPASPFKLVGDLVAERPLAALAHYMAERRYLPLGVPLLKFVGAVRIKPYAVMAP